MTVRYGQRDDYNGRDRIWFLYKLWNKSRNGLVILEENVPICRNEGYG